MKVVLVSHHALPHVGGLEILVDKEVRALVAAGHSVVHITSDLGGAGHLPPYPPGATLLRIRSWNPIERFLHLAYPLFSPRLLTTLWRESKAADVVHVHGFIYMSSLVAVVVAALRGKPRILTDHGAIQTYHTPIATLAARAASETIGRVNCRLATKVVAYNQRVLSVISRLNGGRSPAAFVPYPVDETVFHPAAPEVRRRLRQELGWPDDPKTVLFVGRLNPDKGADLLVRTPDPDRYRIVICGPGDPSILGDLSNRPDVSVLAPRPQSEIRDLYQAADVVAVPTVPGREGFPLVAREALACGTPVVLAYEPGYEPYRNVRGLRFVERTSSGLHAGIVAALSDAVPLPALPADDPLTPSAARWIEMIYA
jgi:glycosyltransferase involved in cell wall biosynthesis